jgi:hypothetical protein
MKVSHVDRFWGSRWLVVALVCAVVGLWGCSTDVVQDEGPIQGSREVTGIDDVEVLEAVVVDTPEPAVDVPDVVEVDAPVIDVEPVEVIVIEGDELDEVDVVVEEAVVEEVVVEETVTDPDALLFGYTELDPIFDLPGMRTEHYSIYSQMTPETTYDIALRCEALYDYYADRFAEEYSPIDFPKLMFLFNNREDFVAAGGHPTMPGLFMGGHDDTGVGARFMMITNDGNWGALVQMSCPLLYHEAFHQFVALEISQAGNSNRNWPTFMDEGHGTLFNNLMWTGDGFVDGLFTRDYLYSAVENRPNFIPFDQLLNVDGAGWHQLLAEGKVWAVYMQSMSVLHFLYYAEDGKYNELIETYVNQVSNDANGEATKETAEKIIALEEEFLVWFDANMYYPEELCAVDENGEPVVTPNFRVTGAKFYEAMTAMAMSQLARTHARGQDFETGEAFFASAQADELDVAVIGEEQWLPDSLREEMIWWYDLLGTSHGEIGVELTYSAVDGTPELVVSQPKFGLILKATCTMDADGNVEDVAVEYVECPSINFVEAERLVNEAAE